MRELTYTDRFTGYTRTTREEVNLYSSDWNEEDYKSDYMEWLEDNDEEYNEQDFFWWIADQKNYEWTDFINSIKDINTGQLTIYADVGRWNGRIQATRTAADLESAIKECCGHYDDVEVLLNSDNDLVCIGHHHDGTSYYTIQEGNKSIGAKVRKHLGLEA